jgi:hypothetical protein
MWYYMSKVERYGLSGELLDLVRERERAPWIRPKISTCFRRAEET